MRKSLLFFSFFVLHFSLVAVAQKRDTKNLVYVDTSGVLRYTKDNSEATFFGVNYTVPFAYGYRSHKALDVDLGKAIDADVYHMSRLGLDAFRVHVWDVEISDSMGNLLENEHLRLFDYLIKKLKERNIKILITPIAFWGNGYPERDIRTNGFSYVYGKGGSVVKEEAFKAQENYLKQFFQHVNPYTKLTYKDDPDVIAMEINNEPHHSGPKERTTEYVNRMADAVRSTGWTKPIFYNISESPSYADAVVKAKVDGHSFQWYPTGLVANHERKGNFLPNVDQYYIPFKDTIPSFSKRALMVYEFDAGDVMQPIMYPAMARSYRTAGFQWATQFAYDPLYTAYGNTEYQTHYLNLAYTPAKAISLLIASKVFHRLPRNKSFGVYPNDTLFDVFRLSYKMQLSEMNSDEEFYYTGNTNIQPKNVSILKHVAGVGSSPVVHYEGTGAYFLDHLSEGIWRLEVMPDVFELSDPFEKASPKKAVSQLVRKGHPFQFFLPGISGDFTVSKIDNRDVYSGDRTNGSFVATPGVYLLAAKGKALPQTINAGIEYYIPPIQKKELLLRHSPFLSITASKAFDITASVAGIDTSAKLSVELRHTAGPWKTIDMKHRNGFEYVAVVPADYVKPGLINYRIIIRKSDSETYTYPGGFEGNPFAWDEWRNESWQTFVAAENTALELFNPTTDRSKLMLYNPDWRNNTIEYVTEGEPGALMMKVIMKQPNGKQIMGWQYYFADKIEGRESELNACTKLVVMARSSQPTPAKVSLITADAFAFATTIELGAMWKEIEIPLSSLTPASFLLLPRPYPGFQPLYFTPAGNRNLNLSKIERLEFSFGEGVDQPLSVEVGKVWLKK